MIKNKFYIQKGDYKVGDKVKILFFNSDFYGKIGRVIHIDLLNRSYKGDNAINVKVKVNGEVKTHLFGESASLKNLSLKERVIFT